VKGNPHGKCKTLTPLIKYVQSPACAEAPRVLYWAFRGDPLFQRVFKDSGCLLRFFEALAAAAGAIGAAVICVSKDGKTLSVAVLHLGGERLLPTFPKLARILACLGLAGLREVASWAGQAARYSSAVRRAGRGCHLLFLGSLVRGRGYGSRALWLAERACAKAGREAIVLDVDAENPALLFYYKRGYRPLGEATFSGRRYVVMAKRLEPIPSDDRLPSVKGRQRLLPSTAV